MLEKLRKKVADRIYRTPVTTEDPFILKTLFALTEGDTGTAERLLTGDKLVRKDKDELERIYFLDPSVFSGINMLANHITAPGYTLENTSDETRSKVKEFLKRISFGTKSNRLIRHSLIFGESFAEIVYNKVSPPTKVVNLVTIDPKSIDLIRDPSKGVPKVDENDEFVGWVQKTIFGKKKMFTKDDVKKGHWPKILHFKLFNLAEGQKGIGLIEPLHKAEKIKLNLEHSFGEVAYRIGLPIVWAKLGDEYHTPTDDQLKDFGEQLKAIHTKNQLVTDKMVDIQLIQPKDISPLGDVLSYFKQLVTSGLGVPELLLYGSGAGVNVATSATILEQFYRSVMTYQDIFAETFQVLIDKFCELEKIKDVPRFVFRDPRPQRLNEFAIRLERYGKAGFLPPTSEIEEHIRDLEDLPMRKPETLEELPKGKSPRELKEDVGIDPELAREIEASYLNIQKEMDKVLKKYGK